MRGNQPPGVVDLSVHQKTGLLQRVSSAESQQISERCAWAPIPSASFRHCDGKSAEAPPPPRWCAWAARYPPGGLSRPRFGDAGCITATPMKFQERRHGGPGLLPVSLPRNTLIAGNT